MKQLQLKKILYIFVFFSCPFVAAAQDFGVDYPKKTDEFSYAFLTVLNDAPLKFIRIKGKQKAITDSIHKGSKIYDCKIKLPGSTAARYVLDSTIYIEFFFNEHETLAEAEQAEELIHARLQKALSKRVMYHTQVFDTSNLLLKQTKIAYTLNRGFFHYNMATQIIRLANSNKFKLLLQVYSGKPQYYYKILKNEPIGSFVWIHQLKKNLSALQDNTGTNCPTNIETFNCGGIFYANDSTTISYYKRGYEDYADARTEFDIYLTHIRVSLGADYVFYYLPSKNPLYKQVAFINSKDLDTPKRATIVLSISDAVAAQQNIILKHLQVNKNIPFMLSSTKKEYLIAICFIN